MSFKNTMADNIRELRIWHQQHHHANTWAECVHEPCNVTNPQFRATWDTERN